jgi:hypothetical protein
VAITTLFDCVSIEVHGDVGNETDLMNSTR